MKPIVQHVTEGGAPIWRKPMLTTPFFECYEPLIETRAFRMWGGYNTLTYFSSIEHEYFAIRNTASLFDLTPMVKYDIRGPDSEAFLQRLLTRDVKKLKKNRVTYTMWCDDDGNVIDDGTVFKLGKDKYLHGAINLFGHLVMSDKLEEFLTTNAYDMILGYEQESGKRLAHG